ncbi:hypothetical protein ACUN0C_03655 [Faunimonas sp. B44]|uniref:hypothetical protein n=1 Tax=Faunimonas sp. B44 TaxID=3461493 RepID=UPI004043B43E
MAWRTDRPNPPPRVRHEPPTIEEALQAADHIPGSQEDRLAFAAGLLGVEPGELVGHPAVALHAARREAGPARRIAGLPRAVVVERKHRRLRRGEPA